MSNTVGDITMLAEGQSYSGLDLCDSVDGLLRIAWLQECQTALAKTVIRGRLYDAKRCRSEYCQIDVDSLDRSLYVSHSKEQSANLYAASGKGVEWYTVQTVPAVLRGVRTV